MRKTTASATHGRLLFASFTVIVVTVSSTWCAQAGATSKHSEPTAFGSKTTYPSTGFGGYSWKGDVREISATWLVPKISVHSHEGYAGTWIGVEGPNNLFIQIGTLEERQYNGHDRYEAFWSDTPFQFHAQNLGPTRAGQHISASLTQTARGWTLTLSNASKSLEVNKKISYGANKEFTVGKWIQEDPAPSSLAAVDSPYPLLTPVRFRELQVNSHTPKLGLSNGEVLMPFNAAIQVPTIPRRDSFTFTKPKDAALQYLKDASGLDAAVSVFDVQFTEWRSSTRQLKSSVVKYYSSAFIKLATTLDSQTWPQKSQQPVAKLATTARKLSAELLRWSRSNFATTSLTWTHFTATDDLLPILGDRVRVSLQLPPP
jgi:hypothetical protein